MVATANFESVVTLVLVQRCDVGFGPGQKIIDNYGCPRRFRKRCDNGVGTGQNVVIMELTQIKKENDSVVAPADFESVVALVLVQRRDIGFSPGQKIIDNYGCPRRFRKRCDNGVGTGQNVVIMELTQIKKENDSVVAPADFESVVALVLVQTTMVAPADFEIVVTMVLAQVKKENDAVVAPVDFESVVALIGTRRFE
ncbi:hypothetical protein F4703DRAFT_1798482 [Phycomyces blakesleeanus]